MEKRYLFECEGCGTKFYLGNTGVSIKYGVPYRAVEDGRSIYLTYYDCPSCDRRHYVQVDDARSNLMKREVFILFKKLSKKRIDGKEIPKKQNEKFKKLNNKFEDYRFELKKELNGKVMVPDDIKGRSNCSKAEVEVHFSM